MTQINPTYLILAYTGMLIYVLMKIEEDRKRGLLTSWAKWEQWLMSNIISLIISAVCIPVLLYICTDQLVHEYFPISTPTAVLVGYQTQSIFRSIMTFASPKIKSSNDKVDNMDSDSHVS